MTIKSEKYAFDAFRSLDGVLRGEPIRMFPVGKWYRGERELDLTPARLQEFSKNIKSGLPQFEVPINLEHEKAWGRYGSVHDVEYIETGPDGPGLYATKYELTDDGKKLIEQEKVKGVSPEAVWTLNDGAMFQDPKTGKYHDNVLVGMALTNSAYFGNDVALFSAKTDVFRTFTQDERDAMAKNGMALPDGSYPIENKGDLQNAIHAVGRGDAPHASIKAHIVKRAKALGATDMLPTDWMSNDLKGVEKMTEQEIAALKAKAEQFDALQAKGAVSVEDFAALKTQVEQFQAVKAENETLKKTAEGLTKQAETFAAELTNTKRARRKDQLLVRCAEVFSAVPDKAETLAEKFQALEEKDPELYAYFDKLLETMDNQIVTSGLFSQVTNERKSVNAESLSDLATKLNAEKFSGKDYSAAFKLAGEQRPDLLREYLAEARK